MGFSKRFPKATEGSVYPKWVEVSLTDEEEKQVEQQARQDHVNLFKDCIEDAEKIAPGSERSDIISMASNLFDKRSSHVVYMKERKCKEKFDSGNY